MMICECHIWIVKKSSIILGWIDGPIYYKQELIIGQTIYGACRMSKPYVDRSKHVGSLVTYLIIR